MPASAACRCRCCRRSTRTLRGDDVTLKDLFVRVGSGRLSASGAVEHAARRQLPRAVRRRLPGCDSPRQGLRRAGHLRRQRRRCSSTCAATAAGSAPSGRWRSRTARSAGSARPAAVQDLNVNAALNGEQLTIERISGNVATGGVVGSFSAKGAAKVPRADARGHRRRASCSTRRSSRSPAFRSSSSGRRASSSRRATSRWPTCRGWSPRTR